MADEPLYVNREAIERVNALIAEGKAEDLLDAYYDLSMQYVYDVLVYAANQPDDAQLVSAQNFARNLLDDWSK